MNWTPVGSITTSNQYTYTTMVTGTLFKLKHIRTNSLIKSLKIVIRQVFEEQGVLSFYDYKLINYKTELDIVLFALPNGLSNRKLAIKRVDDLLDEDWSIEIEQMDIVEGGAGLIINIGDITNLQLQLDSIQAELTLRALDFDFDNHIVNTSNPHSVTANQVGAELVGSTETAIENHESTTNHPSATNSAKGMMDGEDKAKLEGISIGATTNQTDAFLLARNHHTDYQPISSVTGLSLQLDSLEAELTLKATNIELENHVLATSNPHSVTLNQLNGELSGTAEVRVTEHEATVNHPIVTNTNKGLMSEIDKVKLNGITNNATFNESDDYLLTRTNHLGLQPINTIANLQSNLDSKESTIGVLPIAKGGTESSTKNFIDLTTDQTVVGIKEFINLPVIALATINANGFLSNVDKAKLNAINENTIVSATTNSVDNAIALFNSTTGKLLKDGGGLIITPEGVIQTIGIGTGAAIGDARGIGATDLQIQRSTASRVASGIYSFIGGGINNTASGSYSAVCHGNANSVTATSAFIGGGTGNIASAQYSAVLGGQYGKADKYGQNSYSSSRFTATGDSQISFLIGRIISTNNSPTELTLSGAVPSATNRIYIANDTTWLFNIDLVARRSDVDNFSAGFNFVGVIDRNANAASTSLVGNVIKTVLFKDDSTWDADVSADTTNGSLRIMGIGANTQTIRWVAKIQLTEVTG